jgi:hypothetical protein
MKALVNPTNTAKRAHSLEMGSDPLSDIASRCSVRSARPRTPPERTHERMKNL